jgi:hypothetical protein
MDGEGCFAIKKTQHGYQFEFQIELHIDDLAVLNFLQTLRAPLSPLPLLVRGRGCGGARVYTRVPRGGTQARGEI